MLMRLEIPDIIQMMIEIMIQIRVRDRLIDKPSGEARRSTDIGKNDGEYKRSFVVTFNKPSGDSRQTASDNRVNDRNEDRTGNKHGNLSGDSRRQS